MLRKPPVLNVRTNARSAYAPTSFRQPAKHLATQPSHQTRYSAPQAESRFSAVPKRQLHQSVTLFEPQREPHKTDRKKEFDLILSSAEKEHQDILRRIREYEETIKYGVKEIEHASKMIPYLKREAELAAERLKDLRDIDTESSEFLNQEESTTRFALRYAPRKSDGG